MQEKLCGKLGAMGGNALGAILVNELVHGTWRFRFKESQMNTTVDMFERPSTHLHEGILKEFEQIAVLLQANKLNIDYV